MHYSSEVQRRFALPERAGTIPADAEGVVAGVAEDSSLAFWVRFEVQVVDGRMTSVRYRAYGCPQALAAADRVAEELEAQPAAALSGLDLERLAQALELPREKFGILLRIEDALRACHEQENDGYIADIERG